MIHVLRTATAQHTQAGARVQQLQGRHTHSCCAVELLPMCSLYGFCPCRKPAPFQYRCIACRCDCDLLGPLGRVKNREASALSTAQFALSMLSGSDGIVGDRDQRLSGTPPEHARRAPCCGDTSPCRSHLSSIQQAWIVRRVALLGTGQRFV